MRFLWVPKTPKRKVPKKVPKRVDTVMLKVCDSTPESHTLCMTEKDFIV